MDLIKWKNILKSFRDSMKTWLFTEGKKYMIIAMYGLAAFVAGFIIGFYA